MSIERPCFGDEIKMENSFEMFAVIRHANSFFTQNSGALKRWLTLTIGIVLFMKQNDWKSMVILGESTQGQQWFQDFGSISNEKTKVFA